MHFLSCKYSFINMNRPKSQMPIGLYDFYPDNYNNTNVNFLPDMTILITAFKFFKFIYKYI